MCQFLLQKWWIKAPRSLGNSSGVGFKPLANPLMHNTVGRKYHSNRVPKLEGTPMDKIVRTLKRMATVIGLGLMADEQFISYGIFC